MSKFKVGDKVVPYRVVKEFMRPEKDRSEIRQIGKVVTITKACLMSDSSKTPCWHTEGNGHWYEDEAEVYTETLAGKLLKKVTVKNVSHLAQLEVEHLSTGEVRLVGIKNFLTRKEIEEKYGKAVMYAYSTGYPKAFRCVDRDSTPVNAVVASSSFQDKKDIKVGEQNSKEFFLSFLETVKASGKRLAKIVKEEKQKQPKQTTPFVVKKETITI